ncbi:MAG: chromate transporter [Acidaminococcaceae bacterium]|nr:chromate transporter [Acidaminococcaceae bacterium]MBO5636054.1 chromate transporter [Acidaminococcaceae bacterium]MBP3811988.1 chromate transporter [Acidaminococcaceae bacterium]MBR1494197.1 chromate transporter [Acidaminococcaceae bacterium]MBR1662396.1 chromate transporter [Acidaminococcaceae bacterium]
MELLLELFISFAAVGLVCVGGGYASMPLIQAEVIDKHGWLTLNEFIDIFTISQMTPGPIGINAATFVGSKVAGIPGSIAATAGFVFPSVIIVLSLGYLYYKYGNVGPIRGILNGLRPAVVALIASAGVNFILLAFWNKEKLPVDIGKTDMVAVLIFVLTWIALKKKVGTIKLLASSGVLGLILYMAMGMRP